MYFHVMVGANDLAASKTFYDATFAELGVPEQGKFRDDPAAFLYGDPETGLFFVTNTQDGKPACPANGGTIMFKAPSKAHADAWYKAGLSNGGSDVNGAPAAGSLPDSIMGYLRDPTGNKIAVIAFT